jgi:RHS repeat-associated protein
LYRNCGRISPSAHEPLTTVDRITQLTDAINGNTAFTYDPNSNLLTVTDAKTQQTVYTYSNMNRTSTRKDPLLNTETYTYDNNGNVATVTDRKSQVTTYTYDPLNRRTKATFHDSTSTNYTYDAGNRATQTGQASSNSYKYTAREDDGSGLYYYRARYYHPRLQRFIAEDPIGFLGGDMNLYGYVNNNPLRYIDPDGLTVLNPKNYTVGDEILDALWDFNRYIGCDKDVVITGGNRPNDTSGYHRTNQAVDFYVPGQTHIVTANQVGRGGMFGRVGWYEEGYRDPNTKGSGAHVHGDLGPANRRWGFDRNGKPFHGSFPSSPRTSNEGGTCGCR